MMWIIPMKRRKWESGCAKKAVSEYAMFGFFLNPDLSTEVLFIDRENFAVDLLQTLVSICCSGVQPFLASTDDDQIRAKLRANAFITDNQFNKEKHCTPDGNANHQASVFI